MLTKRPTNCIPDKFYLLPKIHKQGMPGRPIVSVICHPKVKISELIDLHLRPRRRFAIVPQGHYILHE